MGERERGRGPASGTEIREERRQEQERASIGATCQMDCDHEEGREIEEEEETVMKKKN